MNSAWSFRHETHRAGSGNLAKITLRIFRPLARILFTAAFAACALAAPLQQGDLFPDLARFALEGAPPDLKGKVVLVDFFASWCAPCQASFPAMEELQKKYGPSGFAVIAVSVDKNQADLDRFLKKHPCTFAILRDPAGKLAAEAKPGTMPTSFMIDRAGVVRAVHNGFHGEETKKKYAEEIESLLK